MTCGCRCKKRCWSYRRERVKLRRSLRIRTCKKQRGLWNNGHSCTMPWRTERPDWPINVGLNAFGRSNSNIARWWCMCRGSAVKSRKSFWQSAKEQWWEQLWRMSSQLSLLRLHWKFIELRSKATRTVLSPWSLRRSCRWLWQNVLGTDLPPWQRHGCKKAFNRRLMDKKIDDGSLGSSCTLTFNNGQETLDRITTKVGKTLQFDRCWRLDISPSRNGVRGLFSWWKVFWSAIKSTSRETLQDPILLCWRCILPRFT